MSETADNSAQVSRFELTAAAITTEQLVRYAGASDDYNRIHYDLPYATAAGLGGVIAHGMLTMAFMGRAATDWAGPAGRVRRIAARFTAPVRVGDVVRVSGVATLARQVAERAEWHCELLADVAGRPVASGEAVVSLPLSLPLP